MYLSTSSLILLALSWPVSAVFFTKANDNDYPRIGRTNFFTSGNGNDYPRIGRRDAQLLLPGLEFSDLPMTQKRGVFTQGPHGSYPRVGRTSGDSRSAEDYVNERKEMMENAGGKRIDENDASNGGHIRVIDTVHSGSPLEVLFYVFDIDSDGKLSKDEFVSGLSRYPHHGSLY